MTHSPTKNDLRNRITDLLLASERDAARMLKASEVITDLTRKVQWFNRREPHVRAVINALLPDAPELSALYQWERENPKP